MDGRWKDWKGKRVYLELQSGRKYTGVITNVEEVDEKFFITMMDKFKKTVCIINTEIRLIQEEE